MSGRDELIQYLGATAGTMALLFAGQAGLRSCLDIRYHDKLAEKPVSSELQELRASEEKALEAAGIDGAMAKVAKNRQGFAPIAPAPSDDLSAMSGWIQAPDHAPYEPATAPAWAEQAEAEAALTPKGAPDATGIGAGVDIKAADGEAANSERKEQAAAPAGQKNTARAAEPTDTEAAAAE